MFLTMMRKDLRLLRAPIVAAILISLFVEFVVGGISAYGLYRQIEASNGAISAANYAFGAAERTWLVLCIGCAFAAIFAGVGAPIERRERWADLAAMLPVPRWWRTLARLLVAASLSLAYLGIHAIVYLACLWLVPAKWMPSRYYYALDPIAAVAIGMFGVAWLGASLARSPAINVGVAVAVILGAFIGTAELLQSNRDNVVNDSTIRTLYACLAVVGIAATVLGTIVESRRVEP